MNNNYIYREITGKYLVEIKEHKSETPMGIAKNKQSKFKLLK